MCIHFFFLVDVDWHWYFHDDIFFDIDWDFLDNCAYLFMVFFIKFGYDLLAPFYL